MVPLRTLCTLTTASPSCVLAYASTFTVPFARTPTSSAKYFSLYVDGWSSGWMPEYLVVICCACAGARLSNTAVTAAAIMRMKSLPDMPLLFHNGRRQLTCLSINQAASSRPVRVVMPANRPPSPAQLRRGCDPQIKQNARRKAGRRTRAVAQIAWRLRQREVARRLLAAFGDDLVVDLLAFHQRAHAGALDGADVHEHILRPIGRLDESESLLRIEKLNGTCRHHGSPCV